MSGKSFTLALIGVAAVGVAIAVGFIAATNLGEGDMPDALATQMAPASSGVGAQAPTAVSSASQAATDAEGQLTAGGVETLAGTLKEVEDNRLTIETQDGAVTAIVEEGAALNLFLKVAPEDLEEGATLTIIGERGKDGITQASSILVGAAGSGIGDAPGSTGLPSGARGRGRHPGAHGRPGKPAGSGRVPTTAWERGPLRRGRPGAARGCPADAGIARAVRRLGPGGARRPDGHDTGD